MTFANAPWAIDGALLSSSLARRSLYASTSGEDGIVSVNALQVIPLSTPGVGVRITPGTAIITNGYQGVLSARNETYTVSNPGEHVIPSEEMPASNPSAKSYILAIVIGDPEFSQAGHPWMLVSDPPVGEEQTFQYVRPTLIEVSAGTTKLNVPYPALPLARIDIPANTTTITSGMIIDLRKVALPRNKEDVKYVFGAANNLLGGSTPVLQYENWPNTAHWDIDVPDWATVAKIQSFIYGAIATKNNMRARFRVAAYSGSTLVATTDLTHFNGPDAVGTDRPAILMGGDFVIPAAYRDTTLTFRVQGTCVDTASLNGMDTDSLTSCFLRVRFDEVA